MYKLESKTTAPSFLNPLKTRRNKRQTKRLRTMKLDSLRIMQCVVKPFGKSSATWEYPMFLEQMKYALPDGVFLLNLTDAVLLRKDGKEPWSMVTGEKSLGEYNFESHIPILGGSGAEGQWDIPIPNQDDVKFAIGKDQLGEVVTDWSQKKPIAVFRAGSPTGCGYTNETNMRLKISGLSLPFLDAGIVAVGSRSLKFDPKEGLGFLDTDLKPVPFLNLKQQSEYKYIVHIDGNVAAYRLLKFMLLGSVILKVKGKYTLWYEHLLKPGVHQVPIAEDLSDLESQIQWCIDHDKECKAIATKGRKFAEKLWKADAIQASFAKVLWAVRKN